MSMNIEKAWTYLIEGDTVAAKSLVKDYFQLETCRDFDLLNLFGYIYLEEKEYDSARVTYKRYIQLAREQDYPEQEHIGLHQLAMVHRQLGEFKEALELIEEEKQILLQFFSDDKLKTSVNDYEQGYLRLKLGKQEAALSFMEKSLENALLTDDLIAQACAYRGLGEIYIASHLRSEAYEAFEHSIALFEKAGDHIGANEVRELSQW